MRASKSLSLHQCCLVRGHFDAIEVRVADALRANEILLAIAVTDSSRPPPCSGGLQKHGINGEDGLR